jgi:hypothetical protein
MIVTVLSQSRQRGLHVLAGNGERLADHFDVPGVSLRTVRHADVSEPARNLGGLGRVCDKADANRIHVVAVPTALTQKRSVRGQR